jgi:hypothetical protein
MNTKSISYSCLLTALIITLTACGPVIPMPTIVTTAPTATKNQVVESPIGVATYMPLPTFASIPSPTFDPKNQPTSSPTPLINSQLVDYWLTQHALATPIRTPVAQMKRHSPRVYTTNGNVYFQNNNGKRIQITNSGKDQFPILSDDWQKIVFYRGDNYDNLYSINVDGSNERLLITSKSLPTLSQGEIKAPTFKPNTHYLLFNTYLCNPKPTGPYYNAPDCTVSIYGVDADTGDFLHQIVAGLSGNTMQDGNFEVSPDGQYISVASSGHINIYRGYDIYYQNAVVYNITQPDEYLPRQFWLPDSSGLLAIVATDKYNEPGTPSWSYAVYRYKLGETAVQIPLDKTIVRTQGDTSCVSPDRNWILFAGTGADIDFDQWRGEQQGYLGNLNNGQTQSFTQYEYPWECAWSPDNKHFVSLGNSSLSFIGSVNGSLPIPVNGVFLEWIDNTHYYYETYENGKVESRKVYIGEITDN